MVCPPMISNNHMYELGNTMEKDGLPRYTPVDENGAHCPRRRRHIRRSIFRLAILTCLTYTLYIHWTWERIYGRPDVKETLTTDKLRTDYETCGRLRTVPKISKSARERNARYVDGHSAVLIRNATTWTGEPIHKSDDGYSWVQADVLMEYGLIKRVEPGISESELPSDCEIYEANGRQLTSGIVDMHSHVTVDPLPSLRGWSDDNELSSDITPYVRSLDGINPLDHQLQVIKSGGVTTSLILPGSGNNMGGEAYVVKHAVGKSDGRSEISAEDMLVDPDKTWRYMKMACGENPKSVYGRLGRDFGPFSRLGEAWYFRHAFEQATALVSAQDDWCNAADTIGVENMQTYLPQDLQWESLGALLRGQVLLNTHCYTIPDLEAFVRHSNEFKFRIQAFHHAHQMYLVPEILKRAYGGRPPAAALFADNMYYKAEAYVASEQAGKILFENGITPVYVSDNPVLNAQHVVFEAAKAYRNGLPYHVALAGVTSASAELLGLGERIGKVKPGFDADIVVWDSDPLRVGAAPAQVWIDGTPQFEEPVELNKPTSKPLERGTWLQDVKETMSEQRDVVISGVLRILVPGYEETLDAKASVVVIRNGSIICTGSCKTESASAQDEGAEIIELHDGHIAPPLVAFASTLGLAEIEAEPDTVDGANNDDMTSRAVDGLALDTKGLKTAFSHGITKAISAPVFKYGGYKGVSAGFLTGAMHAHEQAVVWQDEAAYHYPIAKTDKTPSFSAAVGQLKSKLLKAVKSNETNTLTEERSLKQVVLGKMPLAVTVHSADLIASLLRLKAEVEAAMERETMRDGTAIRMIIVGGAESWIIADALAKANVGVVLAPFLAFAESWDQRRSLTGAPLTNGTAIDVLHTAGVRVAIGTSEDWQTRNLYLAAGIAHANGNGDISEKEALAFVSTNIYDMLGLRAKHSSQVLDEYVVFEGSPLEIDSRVRMVADGSGKVALWT
ncbi:hypothetical protein LTR37_001749 [Vermiconidia calcicola]|uniref:Uncharacterized protein n=1 Tax=Vermiconidia calcicola TaxID=1690605 RepID=A0ACC3NW38_9PEZI|nr:hypothetical protein LTR37_001749 [Vermiconidia calcicola]